MLKKIKIKPAEVLQFVKAFLLESLLLLKFFFLLAVITVFSTVDLIYKIASLIPGLKKLAKKNSVLRKKILDLIDPYIEGEMSNRDIILLATKHLKTKKTRTIITIGGMTIGFGAIIFLLSLGYGFERLVVSRVTNLGEMKQVDLSIGQASSLVFSDEVMQQMLEIEGVDEVLPIVSSVARVSYQNSISDVVAYGVTTRFLTESAMRPNRGAIFEDENYSAEEYILKAKEAEQKRSEEEAENDEEDGEVAGASVVVNSTVALGQESAKLSYEIYPLVWKAVYDSPSPKANIIAYTKRQAGSQQATEVWGQPHPDDPNASSVQDINGNFFSTWIFDSFPLWDKTSCDEAAADCIEGKYQVSKSASRQMISAGYITQDSVKVERFNIISLSNPVHIEGESLGEIDLSITHDNWYQLYGQPKKSGLMLLQFTKMTEFPKTIKAELVVGEAYYGKYGSVLENSSGRKLGYWLKAEWPVWEQIDCGEGCDQHFLARRDIDRKQETVTAYIRAENLELLNLPFNPSQGKVLGESTTAEDQSASLVTTTSATDSTVSISSSSATATTSATQASVTGDEDLDSLLAEFSEDEDLDLVEIISQLEAVNRVEKMIMPFSSEAKKIVLVNRSMLNLLGIDEGVALGETFSAILVFDGKLFNQSETLVESDEVIMTIAGILPDDRTPAFYLPFGDVKGTGIANYSQAKVIVNDQDKLAESRTEIETMGFRTSSVVDTVEQINSLFQSLRLGLLVFGMVALSVAALGMFNTLTVSLLEKTREVGLMKAIGMKSQEVKMLFLAESVIMGFFGGVLGLLFGFLAGQLLSIVLSSIAVASGFDPITATHIPLNLILTITGSSFLIGVLTGFYPAYRATHISALNALRYE